MKHDFTPDPDHIDNKYHYRYGPLNVYFTEMNRYDVEAAQAFGPFRAFLDQAIERFPNQEISVRHLTPQVVQSGQGQMLKTLALEISSHFKNPDGTRGSYNFTVMPDFNTELYLFHAAAREAAGRKMIGYRSSGYFVLSSVKPRVSMNDPAFYGATAETAALVIPKPDISLSALNSQPVIYSTTMKGHVNVHLVKLDLDRKKDRAFWRAASARKGGDAAFGEATEMTFIEVSDFLRKGTTLPIRDALLTAAIKWMDREPPLVRAVQRGLNKMPTP